MFFFEELDKGKTHDFSDAHDTKARVTHILYHLQEHIEYLPGILSGDSDAVFMGYFKEGLSELFRSPRWLKHQTVRWHGSVGRTVL